MIGMVAYLRKPEKAIVGIYNSIGEDCVTKVSDRSVGRGKGCTSNGTNSAAPLEPKFHLRILDVADCSRPFTGFVWRIEDNVG
jgi:hypothetical protein